MANRPDFDTTFAQLKAILKAYEPKLNVVSDSPDYYALETHHVMKNKRRLYFAGIKKGKAYVSFHLMPVYALPELTQKISPDLKKRMQGKACFNFKEPDPKLFHELRKLTKSGFSRFTSKKFYSPF